MDEILNQLLSNIPAIIAVAVSYGAMRTDIKGLKDSQTEIKEDIKTIKNNHLHHVERDINELKVEFAVLQTEINNHLKNTNS